MESSLANSSISWEEQADCLVLGPDLVVSVVYSRIDILNLCAFSLAGCSPMVVTEVLSPRELCSSRLPSIGTRLAQDAGT